MKKHVLEVVEKDEGELLWYEVNVDILLSSLDKKDIHHIQQALEDKKEIRLIKTNSKTLRNAIDLGEKYEQVR